jgi:2-keto-4-pentenoate hydratase/2-oxohepta-3-ene-1,7-dioic acid hydratase in catechol pathway
MKLVRYGRAGAERPGLVDAAGQLRDLSKVVEDITPEVVTPAGLKRLRGVKPERLPPVKGRPRLGCPLAGIGKIVCIGLNYTDHAQEVSLPLPKEPTLFIKANSAISGPDDPIARPPRAVKLDYEVELAAVIGRAARSVDEARALGHVTAYCLLNDVLGARVPDGARRRHHQGQERGHLRADRPVAGHRGRDRGPAGPRALDHVNRERRQQGHTRDMVFSVAHLIAYVSRFMALLPGDLLSTGTPAGVGHGARPPRYLEPGDMVEQGIDGLGQQRHRVIQRRA